MASVRRTGGILAIVVIAILLLPTPAPAQGGERIVLYDVDIAIEESGTILVTERIDYDFSGTYHHGIYRDIPDRLRFDDVNDRVYPIDVLSVEGSPGTPDDYETEGVDGVFRIRIGDPDREITGRHTYTISYRVEGALNAFADHDELYWNAIGDQWSVPIGSATVRVTAPGQISASACYAGPTGSPAPCDGSRGRGSEVAFTQDSLYPNSAFTVVVGLPKGLVAEPKPILEERWSFGRAFEATPTTIGAGLALLVVIVAGFVGLLWQGGRDRRWRGTAVDVLHGSATGEEQTVPLVERDTLVVEFAPPDGLRPGQIGTLVDEVANPLDVTATIIDLAVRGYLLIEEVPKEGWFGKPDWHLKKRRDGDDQLFEYERMLFDSLFEGRDEVLLAELRKTFYLDLRGVQNALYADVAARGWFPASPEKVRRLWGAIASGVLVVGGIIAFALIRFTHLGLAAIPLVIAGPLMLVGARWMPRRTPKGTALRRRILGFREVMDKAETNFARWAEQENVFSSYLPYAIVFGLTEKWAKAFEHLGQGATDTSSWYVSTYPFTYSAFGDSIDGFAVSTAGTIASTPSGSGGSGFGGGGFSGGGGGGGGGGSW